MYSFVLWLLIIAPFIVFVSQVPVPALYNFFSSVFFIDTVLNIPISHAISNSLYVAYCSSFIAVLFGLGLCVLTFFFGKKISGLLATVPLLIGSLGIVVIYSGSASLWQYSPALAIILSHVFLNYPFTYRILAVQFDSYNTELSYLAGSLGATKSKTITTVIFPFIRGAVLRSWCLAFGLSLVESGAASALASEMQNAFITIPIAMKLFIKLNQQTRLVGMSLLLLFFVICVGCAIDYLSRSSSE
jgi:ABC-type spermidine/putrescine transport system permease subunit II